MRDDLKDLKDAEVELLLMRQDGDQTQSEGDEGKEERTLLDQSSLED